MQLLEGACDRAQCKGLAWISGGINDPRHRGIQRELFRMRTWPGELSFLEAGRWRS